MLLLLCFSLRFPFYTLFFQRKRFHKRVSNSFLWVEKIPFFSVFSRSFASSYPLCVKKFKFSTRFTILYLICTLWILYLYKSDYNSKNVIAKVVSHNSPKWILSLFFFLRRLYSFSLSLSLIWNTKRLIRIQSNFQTSKRIFDFMERWRKVYAHAQWDIRFWNWVVYESSRNSIDDGDDDDGNHGRWQSSRVESYILARVEWWSVLFCSFIGQKWNGIVIYNMEIGKMPNRSIQIHWEWLLPIVFKLSCSTAYDAFKWIFTQSHTHSLLLLSLSFSIRFSLCVYM